MTPRRIVKGEDALDALTTMQGGQFATICYINSVPIKVEGNRFTYKNPITNRTSQLVNYGYIGHRLDNKPELAGIVSMTRYKLHFSTQDTIQKSYPKWKEKVNALRQRYGLPPMGSKQGYQSRLDYGHGVKVYSGHNVDKEGRVYSNQNTYKCQQETVYYGLDSQGNIIGEYDLAQLAQFLVPKGRLANGAQALAKIESDERKISEYINEILSYGMEYTTFILDKILYVVGSDENGKFFFVNNNLTNVIDDINVSNNFSKIKINPQQFLKIVSDKFGVDYSLIESKSKKNKMQIAENYIQDIITEAVNILLNNEKHDK